MKKSNPTLELQATPVTGSELIQQAATDEATRLSETRYRRLFQSAKDGILILDAMTGKIIDANAFMAELVGDEQSSLIGKELWELGLFGDIAANKEAFCRLQELGYLRYEHLPVKNQSGETIQVEFICNLYMEGDRRVAQCNVREVTTRVVMEEKIARQTEALADQSRRKDEFLAVLSHELRNPLASIRSAAHLLLLQDHGEETPVQRQAHEVIERQLSHLKRMVRDLLDVSRIATGRISLQKTTLDMGEIVRHAIDSARTILVFNRHVVTPNLPVEPIWVSGDSTRLEEIIVNLLSNAAKFTGEGGRIEVSLEMKGSQAVLRVQDSGAGIATDMLPRIFEMFTQADRSLERSQGGLGIGLSIVSQLVRLHGGTVEAHSAGLGLGSEFIVRLPVVTAPAAGTSEPAHDIDEPVKSVRLLVVDDCVDSCRMFAHILRMKGHQVQTAHSGSAALQAALAWQPEAVMLDIGLPGMNGYEVARQMRAEPTLKDIKLVAITGYGTENDIQLAREAGFDAHLLKPIELTDLERVLAN